MIETADINGAAAEATGNNSSVARNLTVLYASQILTGLLSLLPIAFIPRYLGAAGVGEVAVAGSFAGLFSTVIVMGTSAYIVREIARDHRRVVDLLPSSMGLRAAIAVILLPFLVAAAYLARYPADTRLIILLMYGVVTIRLVGQSLDAALQGLENMTWRSISGVANELVVVGAAWLVLARGGGPLGYILVLGLAELVTFVINLAYFPLLAPFRPVVSRRVATQIFRGGVPFLLWAVLQTVYQQTSSLILSKLGGLEAVGWYSTANQFIVPLFMIPSVVVTVLLPQFSQLHLEGPLPMRRALARSVGYMTVITMPLAFGMAALADRVIGLFHYDATFQHSVPVLRVLAFMLPGTSLLMVLATALAGMNRERAWARVSIFSLLAAVVLNGLLIPVGTHLATNPALGAAVAGVAVELLTLAWALQILGRRLLDRHIFAVFAKTLVAGTVMAGVVLWARMLPLELVIPLGAAVYLLLSATLHVLAPEDVTILRDLAAARLHPLAAFLRRFVKRRRP